MQPARFVIPAIICFCLAASVFYQWFNNRKTMYTQIIDSDGKGYYAYLPAIFIYHDLSLKFFDEKKNKKITRYFNERFLISVNGKKILKTYCGESVLLLPFFAAGSLVQYFISGTANGYEPLIQFFICIGALFYLALGLFYLKKFLRTYFLSEKAINVSILFIAIGTNLFYYTVFHPTMTHVYSFAMHAAFLFFTKNYFDTKSKSSLYLAAATLALSALLRPVNILVVLIVPFLATSLNDFIKTIYCLFRKKIILGPLLLFTSIASIQLLLNFAQCGKFFVWSYGNEGFYFSNPEILNVLFSFRKGLFVYSPILLFAVAGLFFMYKKNRQIFFGTSITLAAATYIISSWWNWYYGPGFGHRAFVDWYAVFAIPLAYVFDIRKIILKKTLLGFCLILVGLNIFQTWQYLWGILHAEEMNREKYNYVFLKTSAEYFNCLGGGNEGHYLPLEQKPIFQSSPLPFTTNTKTVFEFNHLTEFECNIEFTDSNSLLSTPTYFIAKLSRLEKETDACRNALLVIAYDDENGKNYYYNSLRINDMPRKHINSWKNFTYTLGLPPLKHKNDKLKIYVWNIDRKNFEVKNFEVRLYKYKC